jgi:single-strand DNA-binding protein
MLNRFIFMGRMVRDAELKKTPAGTSVCKFSVSVNRATKDKQTGEKVEETDFFDCDAWAGTAETVARYFHKGDMILVEGEMRNNNWTDNSGTKHYGMRVFVQSISFCGGNNQKQPQQQYQGYPQQQYQQPQQQYQQPQQQYQGQPQQQYQQPQQQNYPPIW